MGAAVLDVVNTSRRMRGLPRLDDESLAALAEKACSLDVTATPAGPSSRPDAVDWNVAAQLAVIDGPTNVTITVGGLRPTDWRVEIGSPGDIAAWAVMVPAPGLAAIVTRGDSGYWVRRWLTADGAIAVEPPTPEPVAPTTPQPAAATPPPEQPAPVPPDCGPAPPAGTIKYLQWAKRCQQIGG
jgi:hypothetical protein